MASFKTLDELIDPLREGIITFERFGLGEIINQVVNDYEARITRKRLADDAGIQSTGSKESEKSDTPTSAGSNRTRSPEESKTAGDDEEDLQGSMRVSSSTKKRRKKTPVLKLYNARPRLWY